MIEMMITGIEEDLDTRTRRWIITLKLGMTIGLGATCPQKQDKEIGAKTKGEEEKDPEQEHGRQREKQVKQKGAQQQVWLIIRRIVNRIVKKNRLGKESY
jgi:hypothetical protein